MWNMSSATVRRMKLRGRFGERMARLDADVIIDLTCYLPESARQLVEALRGRIGHLLHCGTIWVHGPSVEVPVTEEAPRTAFGDYGLRKAAIEAYLLREAHRNGLPVTLLHPGHLVGPGWNPVNPQGNFNPDVFSALAAEEELVLPNFGMETVHHVHAGDVAEAFLCAMERRSARWAKASMWCRTRPFPCEGMRSGWLRGSVRRRGYASNPGTRGAPP